MAVTKKLPVVFDYLDINFYLQDYYKFRKNKESDFSYESWSQELALNSRSFLRLLVMGKKKVSPKFVEAFSLLNFATKSEEEYFHFLVKYSQAATQKDKQVFSAKLVQILKRNTNQKYIDDFSDLVSSPQLPRLLTLLGFSDLQTDVETLSNLLDQSVDQVQKSLNKLEELQLATKEKTSVGVIWKTQNTKFKVQDAKGSVDLMKFHEKSLLDAIDAFSAPKELRRYKSLLLPMSVDELQIFYQNMDEFASEQFTRFSVDEYKDRRVFQINLNVHPVTQPHTVKP